MKTNKELNTAYDKSQADRVRPKTLEYNYKDLEAVIRQWIIGSK